MPNCTYYLTVPTVNSTYKYLYATSNLATNTLISSSSFGTNTTLSPSCDITDISLIDPSTGLNATNPCVTNISTTTNLALNQAFCALQGPYKIRVWSGPSFFKDTNSFTFSVAIDCQSRLKINTNYSDNYFITHSGSMTSLVGT